MNFLAKYDFEIKHGKGRANLVPHFLSQMEVKDPPVEEVNKGDLVNLIESTNDGYEEQLAQVYQFLWTGRIESGDENDKRRLRRRALKFVV